MISISQLLVLSLCVAAMVVGTIAGSGSGSGHSTVSMPSNPLNDPDLPNYVAPMVDMAAGSIIIPFGSHQGTIDGKGTHLFNFPTYGLVAHLLWRDIPLRFALKGGKTATTQTDFSVSTLKVWPRSPSSELVNPDVRHFDGGAFIVPANLAPFAWVHIFDYVNGSARLERLQYCEPNTVVVFNATAAFQIPQRYAMTTKPFISVMDSSSYAYVQVLYLRWAGFVFGQHYKQMNYGEANSINGDTCVSYISEPHFKPGSDDAKDFQAGMRQFVQSGGNFIAQCGGIGTYEQCDEGRNDPVTLNECPSGFMATQVGGFQIHNVNSKLGRGSGWRLDNEKNYATDTLYGQYIGPWTWAYGDIESLNSWKTNNALNTDNAAHWVVGALDNDARSDVTFFASHSKLAAYHGKSGGNIFYLAGHEYAPFDGKLTLFNDYRDASPAGARLWLNGALHPANRTDCRATITLPDGTIRDLGELTIDPCRYDTSAPECNTVYVCDAPKYSGYYREGWNYGVELLADYPLSFTMNITLPNRLAVLSVLDVNNFHNSCSYDSTGCDYNVLTAVHKSLPHIYSLLTNWNTVWTGIVASSEDSGDNYYHRVIPFVSSRSSLSTSSTPTNRHTGTSRVLYALREALSDNNLIWDGSLRVIHLYTNSSPPGTLPTGLVDALNVRRPAVVIVVPSSTLRNQWAGLSLPRTTVITSTFPNYYKPRDEDDASVIATGAENLLVDVVAATHTLLQTVGLRAGTDSLGVGSSVTSATVNLNVGTQASSATTLTAVAQQPLNLDLPGTYGTPGGDSYSPMPYALTWRIDGLGDTITVAVFWSEFSSALPFNGTVLENTDLTVEIATNLRRSASITSTRDIFLEVLNITKNGGTTDVWASDFAYVKTADGNITEKGEYYRTDDFIFRTKPGSSGTYVVNYRVYDRCVRSESTITLTVIGLNERPTGTNFTYQLIPGENVTIQWFAPTSKIDDRETADQYLRFSFNSFSVTSSGTLQVFTANSWTNLVPATRYNVTTPIRFLSTATSDVNASFLYNVWDGDNANNLVPVYARFEFTEAPNIAPVISVNPAGNPTLTTAQNTTATFTVTVTDFLADLTTELRVENINVVWGQLTTLRPTGPVDTREYALFNSQLNGEVLISSIALTAGANNNTHTFDFTWSPSINAPFNTPYSFVLFARDPRGLISNKVTVTLRTPANIAPVVVGWDSPSATPTYPESSTLELRNLTIASTDANAIHTERLNVTILTLPALGTLYQSDCTTAIAVNDVIRYTVQPQSDARTVVPVCYVPRVYTSGNDTFNVRATDLAGLGSVIKTLEIVITPDNFPPVSVNVTRSTEGPVTFTIPSSDPDGDVLEFSIIDVNVPAEFGVLAYNTTGTAIAPGQVIAPSADNTDGWAPRFTYTPEDLVIAHAVNFSYRVTDPGTLESEVHWAIINFVTDYVPPIPPNSTNATFTIPEDTTLTINFDPLVSDEDGIPIQIRIVTLPFQALLGPTGSPLAVDSVFTFATNGSLLATYVPPQDFFGTVQFQYLVTDDQGLSSNVSFITIIVTPVNDPPLIEAAPALIVVERAESGSFLINISDIDSSTVSLVIAPGNTVPQPSTLSSTGWTLNGVDEAVVVNVTNAVLGAEMSITVDWSPAIALPDGSRGSFTVYAVDTELLSSTARPVLSVEVVGNDPPTIVPTYTYAFTVDEDFADFDIVLAGTDLQSFHREVLDVLLTSLPAQSGASLSQSSTPVQIGVIASTGVSGETLATVVAESVLNFNGEVTFHFQVRDLLGAVSAVQEVKITVTPVNDPPTSQDEVLVVQEGLCFSSAPNCPNGLVSLQVLSPAVLTASDVDQDDLTLRFTSLPSSGTLYYQSGSTLTVVTSASTFDSSAGSSWEFFYEPVLGEHSQCEDVKNPSVPTCTPFTVVDFEVSDGDESVAQTLTIYVLPVNDPPTGQSLVFTINEDENLTVVLHAFDPDDDVSVLVTKTTGIAPGSRGALETTDGLTVPFSAEQNTAADKTILFTPLPDDFSGPNTFYSRFFYKVVDSAGLISPEYSVTIYVLPVADEIEVLGDNSIRIDEDTPGSFVVGKEGVNWRSTDKGEFYITLTSIPPTGRLTICVEAECTDLTVNDIGKDYNPLATFTYYPPKDENGENFTSFTYDFVLRPEGIPTPTKTPVEFVIHVNPVNDPPVLVAEFPLDPLRTIFDEDTFDVIYFSATDIDSPLDNVTASIVHGLGVGVSMDVYSCATEEEKANGCVDGALAELNVPLVTIAPGKWAVGLNPVANANGNARLTFVTSDGFLLSAPVAAPITVRPINDAPEIINPVATSEGDGVSFSFDVEDIDFKFRTIAMAFKDLSGLGSFDLGNRELPTTDNGAPCYLPAPSELKCSIPIQSIASWLNLIRYRFDTNETESTKRQVADREIEVTVDDLGNIDYRPNMNLNDTVVLLATPPPLNTLIATKNPPADNTGIIVGAIFGLLAAGVIAALAIFFMKKKAAKNVSSYFDRMALDMSGNSNNSPLYQGSAKGAENALYKGSGV